MLQGRIEKNITHTYICGSEFAKYEEYYAQQRSHSIHLNCAKIIQLWPIEIPWKSIK